MANHEFGIIDSFKEDEWYISYEPEKYDCILVDDDLIEELIYKYDKELDKISTYFQEPTNPGYGLDYCGITLIPPNSLKQFYDVIVNANNHFQSEEIKELIEKISKAMKENKYLIHYGV